MRRIKTKKGYALLLDFYLKDRQHRRHRLTLDDSTVFRLKLHMDKPTFNSVITKLLDYYDRKESARLKRLARKSKAKTKTSTSAVPVH